MGEGEEGERTVAFNCCTMVFSSRCVEDMRRREGDRQTRYGTFAEKKFSYGSEKNVQRDEEKQGSLKDWESQREGEEEGKCHSETCRGWLPSARRILGALHSTVRSFLPILYHSHRSW